MRYEKSQHLIKLSTPGETFKIDHGSSSTSRLFDLHPLFNFGEVVIESKSSGFLNVLKTVC